MERMHTIESPIGPLTIVADEQGRLVELSFRMMPAAPGHHPTAEAAVAAQLSEYFAGSRKSFDLEVAPRGTEFQRAVWAELCRIPYGDTVSYADLAGRIGKPSAVRAVGAANGVIGSNGSLTGYGGGIERKQWLLALEGRRLF
jgi:methylated-DNA-[protein]-cysteine S-methyltransferase